MDKNERESLFEEIKSLMLEWEYEFSRRWTEVYDLIEKEERSIFIKNEIKEHLYHQSRLVGQMIDLHEQIELFDKEVDENTSYIL